MTARSVPWPHRRCYLIFSVIQLLIARSFARSADGAGTAQSTCFLPNQTDADTVGSNAGHFYFLADNKWMGWRLFYHVLRNESY